jgi:nitrile hydratase accessory protein
MRREVADMQGLTALPRRNGELVFGQPWESRAFGLAITASEAGVFDWGEFRQRLIAEIGFWESQHGREHVEGSDWSYYARWLVSLEGLLADKGLVSPDELARRMDELEREDDQGHHDHDREGVH